MSLTAMQDLIQRTKDNVRDGANRLQDLAYQQKVLDAMGEYSRRRPRRLAKEQTSSGSVYQTLPTDYEDGFSKVQEVEYPIGSNPPSMLEADQWAVVMTKDGPRIALYDPPTSGSKYLVRFTARHVPTTSGMTVPEADREAVVRLATSLSLRALADYHASTVDPTVPSDAVNYRTKSDEYAARAKEWAALFDQAVPEDGSGDSAAGAAGSEGTASGDHAAWDMEGYEGSGYVETLLRARRPR